MYGENGIDPDTDIKGHPSRPALSAGSKYLSCGDTRRKETTQERTGFWQVCKNARVFPSTTLYITSYMKTVNTLLQNCLEHDVRK